MSPSPFWFLESKWTFYIQDVDSNFTTLSLVPYIFDLEEQIQAFPFSQTEAEFSKSTCGSKEMAENPFSPASSHFLGNQPFSLLSQNGVILSERRGASPPGFRSPVIHLFLWVASDNSFVSRVSFLICKIGVTHMGPGT